MKKRKLLGEYLIVCEGETEKLYFNFLKSKLDDKYRRQVIIRIKSAGGGDALAVVKRAVFFKNELDVKKVWVVFDNDNSNKIEEAFKLADENKLNIVYTNKCFEFWFLLHFKFTTKGFNSCKQVISDLKIKIPDYDKTKTKYFPSFLEQIEQAVQNSQKFDGKSKDATYCDIYKLICEIFNQLLSEKDICSNKKKR